MTMESLFRGLGNLEDPYKIRLKPNSKPFALCVPRRHNPVVIKGQGWVKNHGVNRYYMQCSWTNPCSGMVVMPKANGIIRICVDLGWLNDCVMLARSVPSSLSWWNPCATGWCQGVLLVNWMPIPASGKFRLLVHRARWLLSSHLNKLQFGISSASEHFQKRMCEILKGLRGILCQMDDVLVFGQNYEEHVRLDTALRRIQAAGAMLNKENVYSE